MRPVRKLALKISEFVVTHASPGSKEWAEGLARETDFIERDWSAVGWAFGSVRVLLDYRPATIRSLTDLTVAAEKFAELKRHAVNNVWLATNMRWLNMLVPTLMFIPKFFRAGDGRDRASNGMIVIGLLLVAIVGFIWSKEPVVPDRDDFPRHHPVLQEGVRAYLQLILYRFLGLYWRLCFGRDWFCARGNCNMGTFAGCCLAWNHWPVSTNTAKQSQATAADRSTAQ